MGKKKQKTPRAFPLDRPAAERLADAFYESTGLPCALLDASPTVCFQSGRAHCTVCRDLQSAAGQEEACRGLHSYGVRQSTHLGGRYIYACAAGLVFTVSPIMLGGTIAGALLVGPVRLSEADDLIEDDFYTARLSAEAREALLDVLSAVPAVGTQQLERISYQLFADAVFLGDSASELFRVHSDQLHEDMVADYVSALSRSGLEQPYPIATEKALYFAVSEGDAERSRTLLNELLGALYFHNGVLTDIRPDVTALLTVLSRAAIEGGADPERMLALHSRYARELQQQVTPDAVTVWLSAVLERYLGAVFDLLEEGISQPVRTVLAHLRRSYASQIRLSDCAQMVGYSDAYFSRLFHREVGESFSSYLNTLRIERSKVLLLSGELSLSRIAANVGYSDQSYFCRVFREKTGTTPDAFRKRPRRLDPTRERKEE